MKKRILAWCLCLLLLGLTACSQQETTTPKQEATEAPETEEPGMPKELQSCTIQAGLVDPLLFSVSDTATFTKEITGKAYLFLADDTSVKDTFNSFVYLAILYDKTVLLKSLDVYALGGDVSAGDLDGDGDCEMLLHLVAGATGGAGSYDTRVVDLQGEQFVELFNFYGFDTGYSVELLQDRKYRITNRFTGYSAEFSRNVEDDAYFDHWYDADGTIQEQELLVDSFFACEFLEPPGGGVYELSIRQYTSLVGHSDYIGDAVSVLTYDEETKTFQVTQASFDPQ